MLDWRLVVAYEIDVFDLSGRFVDLDFASIICARLFDGVTADSELFVKVDLSSHIIALAEVVRGVASVFAVGDVVASPALSLFVREAPYSLFHLPSLFPRLLQLLRTLDQVQDPLRRVDDRSVELLLVLVVITEVLPNEVPLLFYFVLEFRGPILQQKIDEVEAVERGPRRGRRLAQLGEDLVEYGVAVLAGQLTNRTSSPRGRTSR